MQVHLLGLDCRGYVPDWGREEPSLCVFQSCSRNCYISKYLRLTRACDICNASLLSHCLENVCFSLVPHLSNYWYLKCIQPLPLSNMLLTLLIPREVGGHHAECLHKQPLLKNPHLTLLHSHSPVKVVSHWKLKNCIWYLFAE